MPDDSALSTSRAAPRINREGIPLESIAEHPTPREQRVLDLLAELEQALGGLTSYFEVEASYNHRDINRIRERVTQRAEVRSNPDLYLLAVVVGSYVRAY